MTRARVTRWNACCDPYSIMPNSHSFPSRLVRRVLVLSLALSASAAVPSSTLEAQATRRTTTSRKKKTTRTTKPATKVVPAAAAPKPERAPGTPGTARELAESLNSTLAKVSGGEWGAMVVSLSRGDTIWAVNPDQQVLPASTMKLFTSALALEKFGPEHRLATEILRDGTLGPDGTLRGNLVIRGGGDPSLSNKFLPRTTPDAPMDTIARMIATAGVKRVTGDIIGDATAFEARTVPEGWLSRYLGAAYAARVSALSLNENLVWVAVTPSSAGQPARVTLEPSSSGIPVSGSVRTTSGGGASVRARKNADGTISVGGSIGARAGTRRYGLVVDDPARFTAGALRDALVRRGIAVNGGVRVASSPSAAPRLAAYTSPTLERIVSAMNRESINLFAELLFRESAHAITPTAPGSAETGNQALQQFLTSKVGVQPNAVVAHDGSGLSTLDRITARAMVQLLGYAHKAPWGGSFHASLPVAGESELLRNRMRYTAAMGNLHAKTGTTNEVIGLAGYVTAENGELLAFSFVYNGNNRWAAKSAIDQMGAEMAGWSRQ